VQIGRLSHRVLARHWNCFKRSAETTMSVVRLLGFATLTCGCVVGRYRDVGSTREIVYVEEKGTGCDSHAHRRNLTVSAQRERFASAASTIAHA